MNAAYSPHYAAWRQEHMAVFDPACYIPEEDDVVQWEDGFSVVTRHYEKQLDYLVRASESELRSRGKVLYTWRNLDDDGEFSALIRHANGRRYLIFRQYLYGCSVLEVETGRDFHYLPAESFPPPGEDFKETFIWTGADYDPASGLLAASGCYWACPNGVILLDFADPLTEHPWFDLHELLDADYDRYDGIDLDRWDGAGGVQLKAFDEETNKYQLLHLTAEELAKLLKRG